MSSTTSTRYLFSEKYLQQQIEKHPFHDYTILGIIGAGSHTLVFHVLQKTTRNEYALKVIKYSAKLKDKEVLANIETMKKLKKSKYICPAHAIWSRDCGTKTYVYILMDFYRGGSLADKLKNLPQHLDEKRILKWVLQISSGLEEFHQEQLIHRNLKPTNLLSQDSNICISDFGRSAKHTDQTSTDEELAFWAPEETKPVPLTSAVDIWSTGIILYWLLTFTIPKNSTAPVEELIRYVPTQYSQKTVLLLRSLLELDPAKRPTATEVKTTVMRFLLETRISAIKPFFDDETPFNRQFTDNFDKSKIKSKICKQFETTPWYIACKDNIKVITESYRVHVMKNDTKVFTIGNKWCSTKGKFKGSKGVAIHDDTFYVADELNHRIQCFCLSTGQFISEIKMSNSGEPGGLSIANDKIYVTTWNPHQVCIYSLSGKLLNYSNCMSSPFGLTVYNDTLYVCEGYHYNKYDTHQIEMFHVDTLNHIGSFGERGHNEKQFDSPYDIVLKDKKFYITDNYNHRVQIWSTSGEYISCWGKRGSGTGEFFGPIGLGTCEKDGKSNLYIVDGGNKRIQVIK